MRIIKRVLVVLMMVAVVLGLSAGGAFFYLTRRPFPQITGEVRVAGLQSPVTVIRDHRGVPHIYAEQSHDLFLAQGYVTAQDRLWQMEFARRLGSGRLAEVLGRAALENDLFVRAIGWRRAAEADYQRAGAEERAALQAYADGVNAFISTHLDRLPLEFTLLGWTGASWTPEPWTPVDSLVWGKVMAWHLGGNWKEELLRARLIAKYGAERGQQMIAALWPPYPADQPVIVPGEVAWQNLGGSARIEGPLFHPLLQTGADIGSNNWVIAGRRTTTGQPLLADDMHLSLMIPSLWYEVGLHCQAACPYQVIGYSFPGVPGVVVGHNDRIAWGMTNLPADVQDLYIERVHPQNPYQVEFQGQWEAVQVIPETVRMLGQKLPDDFEPTANMQVAYDPVSHTTLITFNVRLTRHGPILNDVVRTLRHSPEAVSLKWTALQPGGGVLGAVLKLDRAQNWEEFRAALRHWNAPAQNVVFADVEGNIGYQAPGLIPLRARGDGALPVPGWSGEYEWSGYIPFDELPTRLNPPEGFIVTANHAVVDERYPYLLSREWDYGYRARRITDLIMAHDRLTLADVQAIQGDNYSLFADRLMPYLNVLRAETPVEQAALEMLLKWDRVHQRDRVGASVFEALVFHLLQCTFGDELGPSLEDYINTRSIQRGAISVLLDHPEAALWNDIGTPDTRETRDDILQRAFREACQELEARLGRDVSQWTWGRLHTTTFRHNALGRSGLAPVEALFNRGPLATDGTSAAVNNTGYSVEPQDRYTVISGPSQRFIADLADWTRSLSVHTTGQSGLPFHQHYDDLMTLWRDLQYYPMLWSRADVERNAEGILRLRP